MKLTLPQQDIYFEQLLYPNDPIYNIGAKVEIKGPINVELFKKAYVILINQHDAYRMTFVKDKDNVEAKILDSHDTELGFMDFSCKKNPEEEADSYIQNEFLKPFDLFSGALLHSFTLIKIRDDVHYFFSFYHHILTDGWGISLMFQRLIKNYRELSEFGEVKTVYPFTYKDFAKEDEEYETSEAFIEDRDYWTQKFASLPESLFDKIDDRLQLNKSSRKELLLKREVYNKLNELATVYKSSTFHLILAVLFLYFGRKQQNTDFAVGLPVLNRSKRAYKNTVGLFMGVSPLRIQLDFEATFEDLVNTIKSQLRKDYRHQRFPLGKLIQELHIFKEKERLFNLTLSYEKQNYADNFPKTTTRALPLTHESERVALAMYIREYDESEDVRIDFDYNLNYFDASSITQVVNHFEHLINEVLLQPDKKLKVFNYLSEAEEQQLLEEFNNTTVDYARDETFVSVFKTHVEKAPEKTAVQDMLKSYTYSELHTISNQIAEYLITTYREDNAPIAVMLGRSADMIAVLLGIIKSGRGYIPLDPAFPKDRLQYILESSQTRLMISEPKYVLETTADVTVLDVERVLASAKALEGAGPISLSAKDTAYIIYTSGSTGNPKGVEIGHQSLLNFLLSIRQRPGVTDKDTLFSVTTYSFDISILEFFTPLVSGATLYIANQAILSDPATVIEQLKTVRPSIMQATPSFYQMLFNAEWEGDKTLKVLCGGDLLSESLAAKLLKHSKEVWNMYGPTETTIWSSIKHIEAPEDASNIGKPINNTQFYIVDHYFNIMPIGSVGSLYIGGEGLAKGYYKNTALTDERFIKNPFGGMGLIYETGDIGRWNAIGEIEFLGRNDNQVKIRGYRIELGEIETKLNEISAIKQAVVIAKKTNQQEAFLAAFVVLQAEAELNVKAVIEELKTNLPEYMIPYAIIPLEKFPLTPNRKVDRKALSERTFHQDTSESKAPTTDLEIKLASYWKEILHPDKEISVTDNFFALGGHSLNAVRLTTMVKKHLSFLISLKTIFDYPTIESLAQYLQKLKPDQSVDIPLAEPKAFYPLTPSQYNIWLASQQKNISIAYNMSSAYRIEGVLNVEKLTEAVKRIIEKYEVLRTNFVEVEGVAHQKINLMEKVHFDISIHELSDEENVGAAANDFVNTAFDLANDLLIRIKLFQLEAEKSVLVFCTHHTIMDGWSLEIFTRAFIKNYNNLVSGSTLNEDPLRIQFKDYSEWLTKFSEQNTAKNEFFWNEYLKNYRFKDAFAKDFNVDSEEQNGGSHVFELSEETTLRLKEFVSDEKITMHNILAAALTGLIYKLSNHTDICIGTVNSGRNMPDLDRQIGMFVKTLILRTQLNPETSFSALLENIQSDLLALDHHQDIPFDKIAKSVFDILLVYQNPEFSFENIDTFTNFTLKSYSLEERYSRLPMLFNFYESDDKLKAIVTYNSDTYAKETMAIISLKLIKLIEAIITNLSVKIDAVDISLALEEENETVDFDFSF